MDKQIQFIANYDDWVAVKKLKIEEKTDPKTVMEFLASLSTGLDRKVEENLRKIVELGKLDTALQEEIVAGKTETEIAKVLAAVNSRKINSVIKEICDLPELQKNEKNELVDFCKVYAMKKALNECDLKVDYSSIKIPGMDRLKKTKV